MDVDNCSTLYSYLFSCSSPPILADTEPYDFTPALISLQISAMPKKPTTQASKPKGRAASGPCANPLCRSGKLSFLLCNGCKSVYYCDGDCQRVHWGKKGDSDRHRPVCKAAQKGAASAAPPASFSESSREQTATVFDAGAVQTFVNLLDSPAADVREQSAWVLGNIAGSGPGPRDCVLQAGVLAPLLRLLNGTTPWYGSFGREVLDACNQGASTVTTMRHAARMLSNLCRGEKQPPDFAVVSESLPTVARLLYHADDKVLTDASWALSYLTDGTTDSIQKVIEAGVCQRLVELLLHDSTDIITPTLRSIGNIANGDDAQTQVVLNYDLLAALRTLITHDTESIKKETCWAISNITAGSKEQIQAVIDGKLIPPVLDVLRSSNFKTQKEAAKVICNATSGGRPGQIRQIVAAGCISPLCSLLAVDDHKVVEAALDALKNILRVGVGAPTATGDNPYAREMDACGGLRTIEHIKASMDGKDHPMADETISKYVVSAIASVLLQYGFMPLLLLQLPRLSAAAEEAEEAEAEGFDTNMLGVAVAVLVIIVGSVYSRMRGATCVHVSGGESSSIKEECDTGGKQESGGGCGGGASDAPACASGGSSTVKSSDGSGGSSSSGGGKAVCSDGARGVVDASTGKECYVCLVADTHVVPIGCACRGAAGSAHVACIAEVAAHAFAENKLSWSVCSLCKQWYTGKMQLGLAEERVFRVKHLPETDPASYNAQFVLGRALEHNDQYDRAIVIGRKVLTLMQELHGPENLASIEAADQLAMCLGRKASNNVTSNNPFTAECTEAIKLLRNSLRVKQKIFGPAHRDVLGNKSNLASALAADRTAPNSQVEESMKLYRATLKTMLRVLPENDFFIQSTLGSFARNLQNHAFGFPVKQAIEMLREAKVMLQKVVSIQDRLLGPEHPETRNNKMNLMVVELHLKRA